MGWSHEVRKWVGRSTSTGDLTFHQCIWPSSKHFLSFDVWKEAYNFYVQFYVSVHIISCPSQDPSGIHNLLGWYKTGQGKTRWFESYPCRSSEGAIDLLYTKAKIVGGLAGKFDSYPSDFDLLSLCHAQLWLCNSLNDNNDSHLIFTKPWKIFYLLYNLLIVLHREGEKVQCPLLQVFLWSIINGENVL